MTNRIIAIDFELAKLVGLNAAAVHQQMLWTIEHREAFHDTALGHRRLKASLPELERIIPLKRGAIRVALEKLVKAGLVAVHRTVDEGVGQLANEYEPSAFQAVDGGVDYPPAESSRPPLSKSAAPPAESSRPIPIEERPDHRGGHDDLSEESASGDQTLFVGKDPKAVGKSTFDQLWIEFWGKRGETGVYPEKRGSSSKAKTRFRALLKLKGWAYIKTCANHYSDAVDLFELAHGVRPPILNGATFLNAGLRLSDWEEPWDIAQCNDLWAVLIPSQGRTQDELPSSDDVERFIEAELAAAK